MSFAAQTLFILALTSVVLLWARLSKLDLGLRTPAMKGLLPWIALTLLWFVGETAIFSHQPTQGETAWLPGQEHLSLWQDVVLSVILGPIAEELLFRGALFSSLMRRWGPWTAIIATSVMWGLIHPQYDAWLIASIAGSGVLLGVVRWKSGSIFLPAVLHAGANLLAILLSN